MWSLLFINDSTSDLIDNHSLVVTINNRPVNSTDHRWDLTMIDRILLEVKGIDVSLLTRWLYRELFINISKIQSLPLTGGPL